MNTKTSSRSSFLGSSRSLLPNRAISAPPIRSFHVRSAISRQKKTAIVEHVSEKLKDSSLVFGVSIKGLNVSQMESLRSSIPEDQASIFICKNSLMRVAAREVEGWKELATIPKNDNAWVFVQEDGIASTLKAFLNFRDSETKLKKQAAEKDQVVEDVTSIHGGALGGKAFTPEQIEKLKDLPTKKELLASLAGMLQSVPLQLTMVINQAPQMMANRLEQISNLDEDKTKTAADLAQTQDP